MNNESDYSVRASERSREVSGVVPILHSKDKRRNRTRGKTSRKRSRKRPKESDEVENGDQVGQGRQKESPDESPPDDDHAVDCLV